MPLPLANAALQGLDTDGWVPLKHGSPQSMWPSGGPSAPKMPGRWQLAPQSFLSASPFSTYEGEAMSSGALNLLSEGRTPLVVSVERKDTAKAFHRGTLVRVYDAGNADKTLVEICEFSDDKEGHKGTDGYIGVISAHVEAGQVEVAVSVGGVDLVRYTEADWAVQKVATNNDAEGAINEPDGDIVLGKPLFPGLIPMTAPQCIQQMDNSMKSSRVWLFSAYIDATMLTFFSTFDDHDNSGITADADDGPKNPVKDQKAEIHAIEKLQKAAAVAAAAAAAGGAPGSYDFMKSQRVYLDFDGWKPYTGITEYAYDYKNDFMKIANNDADKVTGAAAGAGTPWAFGQTGQYGPRWKKYSFGDVLDKNGLLDVGDASGHHYNSDGQMMIEAAGGSDEHRDKIYLNALILYTGKTTVAKTVLDEMTDPATGTKGVSEEERKARLKSGTMAKLIEDNAAVLDTF